MASKPKTKKTEKRREWTDADLRTLYQLRREGIPYRLIGVELKRSERACEAKYNGTIWEITEFYDETLERLGKRQREAVQESIARCQDRKLGAYKMRAEIIGDRMARAIKALPEAPPITYVFKKKAQKKHQDEHMGIMLSDAHIGHCHTMEDTGGLSEYNLDIFGQRVENFKRAVTDIATLHSNLYKIPTLHIFCLGDIVAGMNATGNWSSTYINLPIYEQMVIGFKSLEDMIYYWLGCFDEICFYGVRGNHGRAAPLGVEKDYVNWDLMCYRFLEERFRDNGRVKFNCPNAWFMHVEIQNHKFLMIHGDDLKSSGSALKSLENFQKSMIGILQDIPDYTLAAHFHTVAELTTNNGKLLFNGSFIGPDVYSLKTVHASSPPEQKIFGIHANRGITWTYDIDLDCQRGEE